LDLVDDLEVAVETEVFLVFTRVVCWWLNQHGHCCMDSW